MTQHLADPANLLVTPERPWPGLAAFDEKSTGYFFGREADGSELFRLVKRETLTVLFGQSGLGKTSLLQAWLFPHLRRDDCLPILVRLVHAEGVPPLADQFKAAIAAEIAAADVDAPLPKAGQSLWEYFHDKRTDFWSKRQRLLNPVIVIDQFEEIFTLGRASDAARTRAQAFIAELADLIENRPPESLKARLESGEVQPTDYNFDPAAFRVVITLRADFLSELESLSGPIPSIQFNRMPIAPLNGLQAWDAATKPGAHLIDTDVGLRIVQFVAGSTIQDPTEEQLEAMRVEPALLSIICRELNERRIARELPKITADLVAGDRAAILTHFYERCLTGMAPEVRPWVENTLLTGSGYRNSQDLDDAVATVGRATIDTLVARRLVRIDDRFGTQRVELTHDVLAAPVRASRDERQQREALARAAEREKKMRLELRAARRRMTLVMLLVLVLAGFGLLTYWQRQAARAAEKRADDANQIAHDNLRISQNRLVTSLSYESSYLVLTNRIDEARRVLFQGMSLLPDTSVPPQWVTGPLLDIEARFDAPISSPAAFTGHTNRVTSIALSPDGRTLLSASSDWTLKLWDIATGKEIRTFTGHTATVTSVAFSPDGRFAVSGSADSHLILWDVATGQYIRSFSGHKERAKVLFTRDGRHILSGGLDGTLRLWDVQTSKQLPTFKGLGHTGAVNTIALAPDGRTALSGGDDKTLKLWDMDTGAVLHTFPDESNAASGHTKAVHCVTYSPDGRTALSSGDDCTIKLWDLATGKLLRQFQGNLAAPGPPGAPLAHSLEIWCVAFSPDGRRALSGSDDKTLKLWDVATGKEIRTFAGHSDWVSDVAFSRDGRSAFSASVDQTVKQWDVAVADPVRTFTGHTDDVHHLAISPDGLTALSVSDDKIVRLFDIATMNEIRAFKGHEAPVLGVSFAPDGRTALTASEDGTLRLWDITAGSEIAPPFRGHDGHVWSVAFSADGRIALSGGTDKTLRLWDVAAHTLLRTFAVAHTDEVYCVALSPDGRTALSGSKDKTCKFWDVETGKVIRELKGHNSLVISVTFSPDGRLALSGSADKLMILWDLAAGTPIRSFPGHTQSVLSVAFSPDGRLALSGSLDKTVKIWDIDTAKEIQTFIGHTDWVRGVAFTPDGLAALSAGKDHLVKAWDFTRPAQNIEFAQQLPQARITLANNPRDPDALGVMGRWYAFRGDDVLAVQCLEQSRAAGGQVAPLMLGRCYWNLSRYADALPQFRAALAQNAAPAPYLNLCIAALQRAAAAPASRPASVAIPAATAPTQP